MRKLSLSKSTVTQNPHFKPLLDDLAGLDKWGVYNTYVSHPTEPEEFTFRTTTKDLHLKLGLLPFQCQLDFVKMLKWHFDNCVDGQSQILLFEEGKSDPLLVTRTKEQDETIFTLAPAH